VPRAFFRPRKRLMWLVAVGLLLVACPLGNDPTSSDRSRGGGDSAIDTPAVPQEIRSTISHQFVLEPELTHRLFHLNDDMDGVFRSVMDIQSWVFSYEGATHQAVHLMNIPEDAEAVAPYNVPIVGILNYHLFMGGERIEAVRGPEWLSEAHDRARTWEGRTQRVAEVSYMREAYPGAEESAATDEDPYATWSFTVVSPLVDVRALQLVEGTYIVASRIQVLYPPGLE